MSSVTFLYLPVCVHLVFSEIIQGISTSIMDIRRELSPGAVSSSSGELGSG